MKSYQKSEQNARDIDANSYESWYVQTKWFLFDLRERFVFSHSLKWGNNLLDLGSWTGRMTEEFVGRYNEIESVDFSKKSVEILNNKNLAWVKAKYMDATQVFPFKDGEFDAVISCQVIQHFQMDDLLFCLSEIQRVLKNDADFVFSVYNYDYFLFKWVFEEVFSNGLYVKRFNPAILHYLMNKSWFSIEELSYYAVNPILHKSNSYLNYLLEIFLAKLPFIRQKLWRYILIKAKKHV